MRKTISPLQLEHFKEKLSLNAERAALTTISREILRMYENFVSERNNLIEFLKRQKGPKGDAFRFEDFTDYQRELLKGEPGYSPSVEEVAGVVLKKLPPIKDGEPGVTPIKGVDYFTKREIKEIAKLASEMVKVEPGKAAQVDVEAIWALFESRITEKSIKRGIEDITGLKEIIEELKLKSSRSRYIHGGGDTVGAGSGVTITTVNGVKIISASGSGNVVYSETPSGSGVTFTLAHTPSSGTLRLYRGGARQKAGVGEDYTLSGATITLTLTLQSGEILLADYSY